MTIPVKDIKILWGKAGGRCSKPRCGIDCIQFTDGNGATLIGEMAHIIANKPDGPRGVAGGGDDTYNNLILLCPTHHTEIDKSPEGTFTVEEIHRWKAEHEAAIEAAFSVQKFESKKDMADAIKRLLIRNKRVWQNFGPESEEATRNPLSNMVELWNLRKLDTVVPNNRSIAKIIHDNEDLIDVDDLDACYQFVEHAAGFEQNCYDKVEGVKRFPQEFQEVIDRYGEL